MDNIRRQRHKLNVVAPQVVDAYQNGATLNDIAIFFNCSQGTVRNLLLSRGVTMRPKGRKKGVAARQFQEVPSYSSATDPQFGDES